MRALLGDVARFFAERAVNHARRSNDVAWRIRWLRRSLFWSDVDEWISGLRRWKVLKATRERRISSLLYVVRPHPLDRRGRTS